MVKKLDVTDLAFLKAQVDFGFANAFTDPLSLEGLRSIDGTFNNITAETILDQYNNEVDTDTFANNGQVFFNIHQSVFGPSLTAYTPGVGAAGDVADMTPRFISNTIADVNLPPSSASPFLDGNLAAVDALGNPGDPTFDILPFNSLMTFFGQFFDHGLDLINKGGNGTITIGLHANDPLFGAMGPTGPVTEMTVTRASLNGDLLSVNDTAPLVEQSQTYGSHAATNFYLHEYDAMGNATGRLVSGANGGLATWADIKANANMWADAQPGALPGQIMLTDAHIKDIPDPTTWDPNFGGAGIGGFNPGLGTISTGQEFLNDIEFFSNPDKFGMFLTPDTDSDIGITAPGEMFTHYDNELMDQHFVAGDPRINENVVLSAIHDVFHNEHNRLVKQLEDWVGQQDQLEPGFALQWSGEDYFQAAKIINEMQYQHMVFEEFGRRISPNITAFAEYDVTINPNISAEFSQAVYRLGHSMLTDFVFASNSAGQLMEGTLLDAFLDPQQLEFFGGSADLLKGAQQQMGNQIDEFVVDSLRNELLGQPLDLAAINIARGRDVGLVTLNQLRAELFDQTGLESLRPYESWADFGAHMLNPASLVNFIAAYAMDAGAIEAARAAGDIELARTLAQAHIDADGAFMNAGGDQGFNYIDLWIGGLAEEKVLGDAVSPGMLGSTFDFVFAMQMRALQDGDRLYYLARLGGTNILTGIEGQTFSDMIARATGANHLIGDAFGTADEHIEIAALMAGPDFIRTPAELAQVVNEVIGGTNDDNEIHAGAGNDTVHGDGGADEIHLGAGNDHGFGGVGDDLIFANIGDDFLRGDDGDDEIHAGAGLDAASGGRGNDHIFGDDGSDELFGNEEDDTIHGGDQADEIEGNIGNDLLFGDGGDDGLDGGEGDDVLSGGRGTDALVGGAGNNFFLSSIGADTFDGIGGVYNVVSYEGWGVGLSMPSGLFIDMSPGGPSATGDAVGDVYVNIAEVRGSNQDDSIVGDDDPLGNILNGMDGADVIDGAGGDDTLIGGLGDDTLIGGAGVDTALFRGAEGSYTVNPSIDPLNPGGLLVTGADGSDQVHADVEFLLFDDALLNVAAASYIPLVNLSMTTERIQARLDDPELGGVYDSTIIGEAEADGTMGTFLLNDGDTFVGTGVDTGDGLRVANITFDDPDGLFGQLATPTLTGPDAGAFAVKQVAVGTGPGESPSGFVLMLTGGSTLANANYEIKPVYNVTVNIADDEGGSAINYTLHVNELNDNAPMFTSGNHANIKENSKTGTVVYRAQTMDADVYGVGGSLAAATYALSGVDAALFTLSPDGELTFNASPDFEAPLDFGGDNTYNVTITAHDGNVLNDTPLDITINVTDADEVIGTPGSDFPLLGATAGDDYIFGDTGNDLIDGLAGTDTSVWAGTFAGWTLTRFGTVVEAFNPGVMEKDYTDNVENFEFDNAWIALDDISDNNPYSYLASNPDLIAAFAGVPDLVDAATAHYYHNGFSEGRALDTFDDNSYLASYDDLMMAYVNQTHLAPQHYVLHGFGEGRALDTFNEWSYIASYVDLINAFSMHGASPGPNVGGEVGTNHYVGFGYEEGRSITFDAANYLANYVDLQGAFGTDEFAAAWHFVEYGFDEGRTDA